MKVFISWSGELSRSIAAELFEWLPMVVQSIQPYMSSESIDKGTRWASSIAEELEGTSIGIIVLTKENRSAPWINFEAGALAKVVGEARLAPLIFGLKPSEVGTPLSQFQVTQFDKGDMLRLLKSINLSAGDEALPELRLEKMHSALWEQLEAKVLPILNASTTSSSVRSETRPDEGSVSKALEEILTLSRQQAHFVMNPERLLTPEVVRTIVETATNTGLDERATRMLRDHLAHTEHQWQLFAQGFTSLQAEADDATQAALRVQMFEIERNLAQASDIVSRRRRALPVARDRLTGRIVPLDMEASADLKTADDQLRSEAHLNRGRLTELRARRAITPE